MAHLSHALIRLDRLPTLTAAEKAAIDRIAVATFKDTRPVDPLASQRALRCPRCTEPCHVTSTSCARCSHRFPICVATGAAITDHPSVQCSECRHKCIEKEARKLASCPLCHAPRESLR